MYVDCSGLGNLKCVTDRKVDGRGLPLLTELLLQSKLFCARCLQWVSNQVSRQFKKSSSERKILIIDISRPAKLVGLIRNSMFIRTHTFIQLSAFIPTAISIGPTLKNFVGAIYWWVFELTLNSNRWAKLRSMDWAVLNFWVKEFKIH